MSKEGNRKEAKVFVFEDPDEKHRREWWESVEGESVLDGGDDEYRRMEMERRRVWMGLM